MEEEINTTENITPAQEESADSLKERLRELNTSHSMELELVKAGAKSTVAAAAMLSREEFRLDGDGKCLNAGELVTALRRSNPWLFGDGEREGTSFTATAVRHGEPTASDYSRMSDEEFYSKTLKNR